VIPAPGERGYGAAHQQARAERLAAWSPVTKDSTCTCAWRWTQAGWERVQLADCAWHPADPVLQQILRALEAIDKKLEKIMTDQDTANQLAQAIEDDVTAGNASTATALAEVKALEEAAAAGEPLDFTALKTAVGDLGGLITGVQGVATAGAPVTGVPVPDPGPAPDGSAPASS
jgi:hypothetical protein